MNSFCVQLFHWGQQGFFTWNRHRMCHTYLHTTYTLPPPKISPPILGWVLSVGKLISALKEEHGDTVMAATVEFLSLVSSQHSAEVESSFNPLTAAAELSAAFGWAAVERALVSSCESIKMGFYLTQPVSYYKWLAFSHDSEKIFLSSFCFPKTRYVPCVGLCDMQENMT